jgi:membrane protein
VAGLVLGQDTVRHQVEQALSGMVGPQATGVVESMMAAHHQGQSIVATVLGTAALLLGAAGLFGQLQGALDTIWSVKPKPDRGIKGMIRDRFLSLAMVFGICFLLLISMILSTILTASSAAIGRTLSLPAWFGHVVELVFSFGVLTVLFAAMFKFLPDVKIPWRNVWSGGAITAALFSIGKWALAMYLGRAATSSAYGAAGSFVVIIMWIYYAAVIIFLGAELTQVVTGYSGVKVAPTENAVPAKTVTVSDPTTMQPVPPRQSATREERSRPRPRPRPLVTTLLSLAVLWVIGLIGRRLKITA